MRRTARAFREKTANLKAAGSFVPREIAVLRDEKGFLGCAVIVRCSKIRALDSTARAPHKSTRVELQTRSFFLPGPSAKGKYRKTGFPTASRPK